MPASKVVYLLPLSQSLSLSLSSSPSLLLVYQYSLSTLLLILVPPTGSEPLLDLPIETQLVDSLNKTNAFLSLVALFI
jgi:hypothetical protein